MTDTDYPRLRENIIVEQLPPQEDGQPLFMIRDSLIFKDKRLVVQPAGLFILQMLSGENSVVDIQAELTRLSGNQIFPSEPIRELVQVLDENLLLDNDRFRSEFERTMREFREAPVRKSTCMGGSFSADPEELRTQIRSYFEAGDGPGMPDGKETEKPVKAVISPHIDYPRGGPCYAHVYKELAEAPPVDLFIILGTGHDGPRGNFVFSRKDFETPLGVVKTDADFIDRLEEKLGLDLCEEEIIHRDEHSVELQLVFIQLAYPEECPQIVPVLCGGLHEQLMNGTLPSEDPELQRVLTALMETIAETPKRICVMASADLSHMGPHFGDDVPVSEEFLEGIEADDRAMLDVVQSRNADDFFKHVMKDKNRRRVCGLASIYTALSVTQAEEAELLSYGQTTQPTGDLAVTFCGMTFR